MIAQWDAAVSADEQGVQSKALLIAPIKVEGPELWHSLRSELASVGRAYSTIGAAVEISEISSDIEEAIRVSVSSIGAPRIDQRCSLYIQVFYAPKEGRLRCYSALDDAIFSLWFCVSEGHLALRDGCRSFDGPGAVSRIIEPLAKALTGWES